MSSRNRRGGGRRFVALQHFMLNTLAWKGRVGDQQMPAVAPLSPNAKAVLVAVWQRHNGTNNGYISYAVREAVDVGLSKDQAARALAELLNRGFLKMARNSSFNVKNREARTWTLTAEAIGSTPPTMDFTRWSPDAQQSHQRDCEPPTKRKTQSHQRDTQSHQRDCEPESERILPLTVAPARLSGGISGVAQSHQRDTSILPGRGALAAAAERARWWRTPPPISTTLDQQDRAQAQQRGKGSGRSPGQPCPSTTESSP